MRKTLSEFFSKAQEVFDIPFVALNIDLYQHPRQNKKYLALRTTWTFAGAIESFNLAVRGYSPSFEERRQQQASDLLKDWTDAVLLEFGIDREKHVLSATSDSGSDVRRALDTSASLLREWCLAHLMNLCLVDAFGMSLNPNKSKNPAARNIVTKVRSLIETVNKSGGLKALFDETVFATFGRMLKLKSSPSHRWAAIEDVFERVLILWKSLEESFTKLNLEFCLSSDRQIVTAFFSLVSAVRKVQQLSQRVRSFVAIEVFAKLVTLYSTTLDPSKPLELRDCI